MEIMYSNENIMTNVFRRRSTTTTSDVGDSLYTNDLEWDKSDFTRHLSESDALTSYDINEMTEIFRYHFLDFDMSSQIFSSISNEDFSILNNENYFKKYRFHRSLSEINMLKQQRKNSFIISKHLSLMDIKSIQSIFIKSHQNFRQSNNSILQSMEIVSEGHLCNRISTVNSFHLSKLSMIYLYLIKIKEKFSSFISQIFHPTKTILITNEIIDTYDII